MSAGTLLAWLGMMLPVSASAVGLSLATVRLAGWRRENYAGQRIAVGYGIFLPVLALVGIALAGLRGSAWAREAIILGTAVAGCGAFGLLDDLYGRSSPKGLTGHFRLLFRQGQVTTGQLKAIGVAAVGVAAGVLMWERFGAPAIVSGALIALCANGVNLLDTRPGRAVGGGLGAFACIAAAAAAHWPGAARPLAAMAPFALGCLVALPVDRGQRAMLGDVGAYSLGAGIGAALALIIAIWAQAILVALLIGLTFVADRYSFSVLLERR